MTLEAGNGSRTRDIDLGKANDVSHPHTLVHTASHITPSVIKNYAAGLMAGTTPNHTRPLGDT